MRTTSPIPARHARDCSPPPQEQLHQDYCSDVSCPGLSNQDGRVRVGYRARLRDNGDGTITDEVSGLTWEKLSNDGSVHERSAMFSFADAITVKIAALNAGSGFAGHTDWRLPNRRELESLVDAGRFEPAGRRPVHVGKGGDGSERDHVVAQLLPREAA